MPRKLYLKTLLCTAILFTSACSISKNQQQGSHLNGDLPMQVNQALTQAINKQDYRLFHTKGRRIILPGLEQYSLTRLKERCGIKAIPTSTDVLKTEEQKQQRKATYDFAKQYNQHIYPLCMKSGYR